MTAERRQAQYRILLYQARLRTMVKQIAPLKRTRSRWHAVSVICKSGSCEAARALKGQRFLSAEAPRLPLPQCTSAADCPCVYRKHADRRAGPRREEEKIGLHRPPASGDQERRRRRGRRSTDHTDE
jgi:hypothetical protein